MTIYNYKEYFNKLRIAFIIPYSLFRFFNKKIGLFDPSI